MGSGRRCVMGYFDKLAELGFMVLCRRNQLGTTTMFAVHMTEDFIGSLDDFLCTLPDWRVVDFVADDAGSGARLLYEKLTCTGHYAKYETRDERVGNDPELVIGMEERPEEERFQPVED